MVRMGIRGKLVGAFVIITLAFVLATAISLTAFAKVTSATRDVHDAVGLRADVAETEVAADLSISLQYQMLANGWTQALQTQLDHTVALTGDPTLSLASNTKAIRNAPNATIRKALAAEAPELKKLADASQATADAIKNSNHDQALSNLRIAESEQQVVVDRNDAAEEVVNDSAKAGQAKADDAISQARSQLLFIGFAGALLSLLFALLIGHSISQRTRRSLEVAQSLSMGDTEAAADFTARGSDEVGKLGLAFEQTRDYLADATGCATRLAAGDLSQPFQPRSEQDALGNALNELAAQLSERVRVATEVASGNVQLEVAPASDVDELGHAFAQMVGYLRERSADAQRIAQGDLSVNVDVRGAEDGFGTAFLGMLTNLRQRAAEAGRIADGDLTAEVVPWSDSDELGHALSQMVRRLRAMIGDALNVAESLQLSSQQLSAMSHDVGRGMEEIAGSIGELAAGSDSQVRVLEEQRTQATEASMAIERSRMLTEGGLAAVMQATDAMSALDESSRTVTDAIRRLADQTNRIGDFVGAVSNIADQTNLLALNAAIEAARAGDAGRGFAVVADEVRKLAEESQTATNTIAEIVAEIQRETGATVEVIEESVEKTGQGAQVVGEAQAAFTLINDSVQESSERIAAIVGSADMVAAVAQQSSSSTEQVSAATEETSASMQEMSASSQELARTAEQLLELTAQFNVDRAAMAEEAYAEMRAEAGGGDHGFAGTGVGEDWSTLAGLIDYNGEGEGTGDEFAA